MTEHDIIEAIERSAAEAEGDEAHRVAEAAVAEPDPAAEVTDAHPTEADLMDEVDDAIDDDDTEDDEMDEEHEGNGALMLPERVLHGGIRRVQEESGRVDVVGVAARALLSVVHAPAATAADFFSRLEHESVVLARPAKRRTGGSGATPRRSTANGNGRRTTGTRSRATAGRGRGRSSV